MEPIRKVVGAVLAGGLGLRLRSVVADRPKVLAEVAGRPFLAYLLQQLASAGLTRTVLLTGHQGQQIEEQFGGFFEDMRLICSREPIPLNTGGALRHALPIIDCDTILVLNGDSYCDLDLGRFLSQHLFARADCTIALSAVADASRFGTVRRGPSGVITSFEEKSGSAGPGLVSAGVYLLARSLLEEIPAGQPVSLEREMFPAWARAGRCHGYVAKGTFLDIGTPESYANAASFFRVTS